MRAVCRAYLDFATERPALYQAMFVLPTDVKFASAETPPPLRAAFGEFVSCFRPDDERRELFAEVTWSALHGMAVLSDSGRIPRTARRSGSISSSLRSSAARPAPSWRQ
ncbi:TetR-like C-terminal domain-containing protein [Nonomuraea basaltis]|uniref:TetR-like C-terminal domain-containing protein n=1 Tax=Nonomuraea basaltis TaxID=2495887 RepID=UPI0023F42D20|nr:TetR-like C-terminal domain-containing protein [Nonomuraea basaltis]